MYNLRKVNIGIMPLYYTDFNKGKCSFKLIQYMGVSAACVCSPIGMNIEVVTDGINGFWATTEDEWYESLKKLIYNAHLRVKMGAEGYNKFSSGYTYQSTYKNVMDVLIGRDSYK
jgi:glycosyltransferase involved in cell wall biosynthesis